MSTPFRTQVLAIMQNQWFKEPARVKQMLEGRSEAHRRRFIARALFAGCRSGKVLMAVFGPKWIHTFNFEEASREIGGHAGSVFAPDPVHILTVYKELWPRVIITFGEVAKQACAALPEGTGTQFIHTIHPTARNPMRLSILEDARRKLEMILPP